MHHLSIRWQMLIAISLIFVVILLVNTIYFGGQQKEQLFVTAKNQAIELSNGYFDGLNTMMLTGTISNREILREKLKSRTDIIEARVVRGPELNKQYGQGVAGERPIDDHDFKALQGEKVILLDKNNDGRVLTVINPFIATSNTRGTNCLTCHAVKEGTVLGAVRIDFSLVEKDKKIEAVLWGNVLINIVIFSFGLVILGFILEKFVVKPIRTMNQTILTIHKNADLTLRLDSGFKSEMKEISSAVNGMIIAFQSTIKKFAESIHSINVSAKDLAHVADDTKDGILDQQAQTDMVATAVNEMSATVQDVAKNAEAAAKATSQADIETNNTQSTVQKTIDAINQLSEKVQEATSVIRRLEQDSDTIGKVLDVIKEIADQTNLLALNAAIEAARAGDLGRGFAVVAEEVRTLASRTQDSTREIEEIIDKLQSGAQEAVHVMKNAETEVQTGVNQVENAGASLQTITTLMGTINQMNSQIATAAEEQSSVAEEINKNIIAIKDFAYRTTQSSQKTATASENLAALSENLASHVDQFKI